MINVTTQTWYKSLNNKFITNREVKARTCVSPQARFRTSRARLEGNTIRAVNYKVVGLLFHG